MFAMKICQVLSYVMKKLTHVFKLNQMQERINQNEQLLTNKSWKLYEYVIILIKCA